MESPVDRQTRSCYTSVNLNDGVKNIYSGREALCTVHVYINLSPLKYTIYLSLRIDNPHMGGLLVLLHRSNSAQEYLTLF